MHRSATTPQGRRACIGVAAINPPKTGKNDIQRHLWPFSAAPTHTLLRREALERIAPTANHVSLKLVHLGAVVRELGANVSQDSPKMAPKRQSETLAATHLEPAWVNLLRV